MSSLTLLAPTGLGCWVNRRVWPGLAGGSATAVAAEWPADTATARPRPAAPCGRPPLATRPTARSGRPARAAGRRTPLRAGGVIALAVEVPVDQVLHPPAQGLKRGRSGQCRPGHRQATGVPSHAGHLARRALAALSGSPRRGAQRPRARRSFRLTPRPSRPRWSREGRTALR
jgi:hypothetical protein